MNDDPQRHGRFEVDEALARQDRIETRRRHLEIFGTVGAAVSLLVTVGLAVAFVLFLIQQSDEKASSARDDCRAVITAARRDVLDELDRRLKVDTARQGQILGNALLGGLVGERPDANAEADYRQNNADLTRDLMLNDELAPTLPDAEEIVRDGGRLPVIRPDGTVGSRRFDPCPTV